MTIRRRAWRTAGSSVSSPCFGGAASGFEVPSCRYGPVGDDGLGEYDGFMDDDQKVLEGLGRKMIPAQQRPTDRLVQRSQESVPAFGKNHIHGFSSLIGNVRLQSFTFLKEMSRCANIGKRALFFEHLIASTKVAVRQRKKIVALIEQLDSARFLRKTAPCGSEA